MLATKLQYDRRLLSIMPLLTCCAQLHFLDIKMGRSPPDRAELTKLQEQGAVFLETHPMATIFVIIDSIVSEGGQIVHWTTEDNFHHSDWVAGVPTFSFVLCTGKTDQH